MENEFSMQITQDEYSGELDLENEFFNEYGYYNSDGRLIYHREDGPAFERMNGDKIWYRDGLIHREGGPAIEYMNGDRIWYSNGKLHREDGPACEYGNGKRVWYLNDEKVNKEKFEEAVRVYRINKICK
jgi:hypothetical protein